MNIWLLPLLPLLFVGCDGVVPSSMVTVRPPSRWEASLERSREAKDDAFRTSPETPLLAEDVERFEGLDYWPADARYYFAGPIHVYAEKRQFEIITTAGKPRPCEQFGWFEFPLDGTTRRLQVYRLLDTGLGATTQGLMLPFADATTGKETYPSGRYIDIGGPAGEIAVVPSAGGLLAVGPFVVDFNRAYNPSCAYGAPERFACPVTPKDNRLEVRIEAGERGFKLPPDERSG
jgi:uncharacterized protein (DUF1684 family)